MIFEPPMFLSSDSCRKQVLRGPFSRKKLCPKHAYALCRLLQALRDASCTEVPYIVMLPKQGKLAASTIKPTKITSGSVEGLSSGYLIPSSPKDLATCISGTRDDMNPGTNLNDMYVWGIDATALDCKGMHVLVPGQNLSRVSAQTHNFFELCILVPRDVEERLKMLVESQILQG